MELNNKNNLISRAVKTSLVLMSAGCLLSANIAQASLSSSEQNAQKIWQVAIANFQAGNADACYSNLQQLDSVLAGDVTYDRLFGLCAQGADLNDKALLAYNRILAQQPNNAEIRLEHARVLYNLELNNEARREFQWLRNHNPPRNALLVIDRYLDALEKRMPRVRQYTQLKISTSLGYDDNVNSASELDDFLGFTLNSNSKAQSSSFGGMQLALSHMHVISHDSGLRLSTSLGSKRFPDADFVDQDLATVGIGYIKHYKRNTNGLDILGYRQNVDGDFNSEGAIVRGYSRYRISTRLSVTPYFKASAFRYSDEILTKNVNQYIYGASLAFNPDAKGKSIYTIDYGFGRNYPVYEDSNYETDINTLKLSYQHKFSDDLRSNTILQYDVFNYKNPFFSAAFPEPRDDDYLSLYSQLNWNINKNLSFTPKLGYRDLSSSVDIYSYERWFAELNLNYQWQW